MRDFFTSSLAALVTVTLVGSVLATAILLQQQASAIVINWKDFKELTHEFEKNVINAIGDPNISPQPRELLVGYVSDVNTIFVGDPNIDLLLQSYKENVTTIFDQSPPEPDKQNLHDQINEFKQLTHTFRTEVLELAHVGLDEPR
jgi:hypothetical protein